MLDENGASRSIGKIEVNGPLDFHCVDRISANCKQMAADPTVGVVVLSVSPDVWTGWSDEAWNTAGECGLIGDPFGPIAFLPQPTIISIAGEVRDAGVELALCADIRIADAAAVFSMTQVGSGHFPIAGGLQRLVRAIGRAHALEFVLAGKPIDAPTAMHWGLISHVASTGETIPEALAWAERIAQFGLLGLRAAKEAINRGSHMSLDEALRFETDLAVLLQTTKDRTEGVRAFMEKRPPKFGR